MKKNNVFLTWIAKNQTVISIILAILMFLFPLVSQNPYALGLGILFFINAILAMSSNFITGYAGILSIGQAAFFGVGAYAAAILARLYQVDFIVGLVVAILVAMVFGWLVGMTSLRVRDKYLAMVTLGVAEIIRIVALNWESLTRGAKGITAIPGIIIFGKNNFSYQYKYYAALIVCLLVVLIINAIMNSKLGRAILLQRDDELAAISLGLNTGRIKQVSFAISAGIAGAGGALYAHYMNFLDPNIFAFDQSIFILSMAILGGLGSLPGSILGAFILTVLPEVLRFSNDYRLIIYGLVIVLLVLFKPSGLLGNVNFEQIRNKAEMEGE